MLFAPQTKPALAQADNTATLAVDSATLDHIRRITHQRFLQQLEYNTNDAPKQAELLNKHLQQALAEVSREQNLQLSDSQRDQLMLSLTREITGLGPLSALMLDPHISDILVNSPDEVWVEKNGRLLRTAVCFDDEAHLRRILDRLIASLGKQLDAASPAVDARLSDGSRLHAVVPPLSTRGAVISIRRFRRDTLTSDALIDTDFIKRSHFRLLARAVQTRKNIVIAGGAGVGKTTLLNILASHIPEDQRIVTVEETAELSFRHPHVISLETRSVNMEGRGEFRLRDLLRNALRMRADRIIVGEVRGEEVLDMLQAMNIGHDGSLSTVHANSAHDVFMRLETLAMLSNTSVPRAAIVNMICAAVDLIVHISKQSDGQRRVNTIAELQLLDGKPVLRTLYQHGLDKHQSND